MTVHLLRRKIIRQLKSPLFLKPCWHLQSIVCLALVFTALQAHSRQNDHSGNSVIRKEARGRAANPGTMTGGDAGQKRQKLKESLLRLRPTTATLNLSDLKKKGTAEAFDRQHQLLFRAEYLRNELHGLWRGYYPNGGLLDEGRFRHQLPDGIWRHWYASGQLRSLRSFDAGKWEAMNSEVNRGNAKTIFHTGSIPGGSTPQNFKQLSRQNARLTHPVEADYQFPFTLALAHGLAMNYFPNGQSADSGYFKNGLREGLWEAWYENGQLSSRGAYHIGLKQGPWKYYSAKGNLDSLKHYHRGLGLYGKHYHHHRSHQNRPE